MTDIDLEYSPTIRPISRAMDVPERHNPVSVGTTGRTHDTPEAALAAALAVEFGKAGFFRPGAAMEFLTEQARMMLHDALAALPPGWCGHLSRFEDMTLEIARLRAALKAGVEIVTAVTEWGGNCGGLPQTLQDRADWWRLDVDPVLEARQ